MRGRRAKTVPSRTGAPDSVTTILGGVRSAVTATLAVAVCPALSVAVAVRVTGPSGSGTLEAVKAPPAPTAAATPLTETETRFASVATPVTEVVAVFR